MEPRLLLLTLPSLAVLALLVRHSGVALLRTSRKRAGAFWISVAVYGVARGAAVAAVTRSGLGAPLPYVIHRPVLPLFGVSLQEVAGWAIVAYLAWWLGARWSPRLFQQVAWGCLFLGAVSWAVETAAVAAGWWHWTVPAGSPLLLGVPWIGLVDWLFVGTDFLLPFLALTAPALAGDHRRWLSLLLFPLHMAGHLWVPGLPLVHALLLAIVLWLALRSRAEDAPFAERAGRLPALALGIVLLDAALVQAVVAHRPSLLPSLLPAAAVALQTLAPAWASALAAAALLGALALPPLILGVVPAAVSGGLRWLRRRPGGAPVLALAVVVLAIAFQARERHGDEELQRRLGTALAARNRGDLAAAESELGALARDFPGSHVPPALLGEIRYRTGRPEAARPLYEKAVAIQPSFLDGWKHLAVIDLQAGRTAEAATEAGKGLAIAPADLELRYLERRAEGGAAGDLWPQVQRPEAAAGIAGLAFEVGDAAGAATLLDRALARWPEERKLRQMRAKLALAMGGVGGPG
jgi:tetratricopeptide (TPR) repeat protein